MFEKRIVDIKIANKEISVIREAKIPTSALEAQISTLPFSGAEKPKNPQIENAKLPPFIQSFYYLFYKELRIPSENEFCDYYLALFGGVVNGKVVINKVAYDSDSLLYRMKRTYPSLLRDLHFLYLLEESGLFEEVEYSMKKDYCDGLDLKLKYTDKEYYVSLYIDSPRGGLYKKKKKTRHDYSAVNEIEFSVGFSTLTKFGSIYLLTKEHIKLLAEKMTSQSI